MKASTNMTNDKYFPTWNHSGQKEVPYFSQWMERSADCALDISQNYPSGKEQKQRHSQVKRGRGFLYGIYSEILTAEHSRQIGDGKRENSGTSEE